MKTEGEVAAHVPVIDRKCRFREGHLAYFVAECAFWSSCTTETGNNPSVAE